MEGIRKSRADALELGELIALPATRKRFVDWCVDDLADDIAGCGCRLAVQSSPFSFRRSTAFFLDSAMSPLR